MSGPALEAREPSARYVVRAQPALVRSFELLATANGGVAKLRELILLLAVRGKLEPQSESEQSADLLLTQIRVERSRLVASGRIKRDKALPEAPADGVPWSTPSNWAWARLGELGRIVGGGTPKSEEPAMWAPPSVPWLTPADLYGSTDKHIARGRRDISEKGLASSSAQLLPPGTVLFSSRAPIGYVAIAAASLATNQGFKSCVPHLPALADYLYWFLKCSAKAIDAAASGTTFKEISGAEFSKVLVPLPPLAEQHRIVARVEELMKLCDALEQSGRLADEKHARLTSTLFGALAASESAHALAENWQRIAEHFDLLLDRPEAIDALEQAILQLTVRGSLVSQSADDESVEALLRRFQSSGIDDRSSRRGRVQLLPAPIAEEALPFDVPPSWAWARFAAVAHIASDLVNPFQFQGARQVAPDCIEKATGRLVESRSVRESGVTSANHRFRAGQILYSKIRPSLSKVVIVDFDGLCSADMYPIETPMHTGYLHLFMLSGCFLEQVKVAENRVKMPKLNQEALNSFLVAVPPLAEQHRIVARVEELRRLCAQLRERLTEARRAQSSLADALVSQAVS